MVSQLRKEDNGKNILRLAKYSDDTNNFPFLSIFKNLSRPSENKTQTFGKYSETESGYSTRFTTPLTVSEDRTRVAFLALYNHSSAGNWFQNTSTDINTQKNLPAELWLTIWDLQSNKFEKKMLVNDTDLDVFTYFRMQWCPAKNSDLLSLYTRNALYFIDMDKGKTIRKFENNASESIYEFTIIRWSPDGSMLGMMKEDGNLYIYDVNKGKLKKIKTPPGSFNFVWVK